MPKEDAATQVGAADGEEKKPLTQAQVDAIQRKGYEDRLAALDVIQVNRDDGDGDNAAVPAGDEDEERERLLKDLAEPKDEAAADQVKATQDDEDLVIDAARLARVKFVAKIDGKEEVVDGAKVLATFQKDRAADARLAKAVEQQRAAEAALAEAQKKLSDANEEQEKRVREKAVASSKEKLVGSVKEAMESLYEGDSSKASEMLAEIIAATVSGRTESATPNVDADHVASQVEQRIEIKGALNKLFSDYPQIKEDPDYAVAADRMRDQYERAGHSRATAILMAGEEAAKKFGLSRTGKSGDADSTTLDGKRSAKERGDVDDVTRAGAHTSGVKRSSPENTSSIIAEMARQRATGRA